jgi:hypothetical protein
MEISIDPKKCSMCHQNPIKYTCPRCSTRTCSLSCCLNHKKTLNCNGQRDKTSFKSLNAMNDLDILSDYRFMEDVNRKVEISKRDQFSNHMKTFNESTRFQKLIQNKLKTLRSIQILYLPRLSTRHKQNQMWFDKKSNEIFWHIECRFFVNSLSDSFYTWTTTRLPTKETTLSNLLKKFHGEKDGNLSNPDLKKFWQVSDAQEELCVYIENFGQKRKQFGHFEKRSFDTIIDLFRDRILIEYPILFISLNNDENEMKEKLVRKKSK